MGTGAKFIPPGMASLEAATSGTGRPFAGNDARQASWKVIYPGTAPTTGTVLIEQAPTIDYAGVWNQLDSVDCSLLSAGTAGFGTYPGEIDFVRARITSAPDQAITVYVNFLLK